MTNEQLIKRKELDLFRFENGYDMYYHDVYTKSEKALLKRQMEDRKRNNNIIQLTRKQKLKIEEEFIP